MKERSLRQVVRPALLARKPLERGLTIAQNVLKHGTGALNIDGCRFGYGDPCWVGPQNDHAHDWDNARNMGFKSEYVGGVSKYTDLSTYKPNGGRWPANLYQCSEIDNWKEIDKMYTQKELENWEDIASARVLFGDCMEKMKEIPSCSIDAIVCDPPYGMSPDGVARTWADIEEGRKIGGFMGKAWDAAVPCHNFFAECYRVLKHGGHLIAFSSTRTVFALGMACQKGGFELRDQIFWCYFSGFPKSHDISKAIDKEAGAVREVVGTKTAGMGSGKTFGMLQSEGDNKNADQMIPITKPATKEAERWNGFGTALKPAVEPALLARKPLEKGLTIAQNVLKHGTGALNIDACRFGYGDPCWVGPQDADTLGNTSKRNSMFGLGSKEMQTGGHPQGRWPANLYQCAKASRSEREAGLSHLKSKARAEITGRKEGSAGLEGSYGDGNNPYSGANYKSPIHNFHPTVKPLKLMRWCCRLIGGQKGSVILDPFGGSGTTGAAAILEGFDCILIEREAEYLPIIEGRLQWARQEYKRENAQLKLFND